MAINTYPKNTPDDVAAIINRVHEAGTRVRIFYGDLATGHAAPEENDVVGTIGASTGSQKVPLLIASAHSKGGVPLFGHIVAIKTHEEYIYRHPNFSYGLWSHKADDGKIWVYFNNAKFAPFDNIRQAEKYIAFMQGMRWTK